MESDGKKASSPSLVALGFFLRENFFFRIFLGSNYGEIYIYIDKMVQSDLLTSPSWSSPTTFEKGHKKSSQKRAPAESPGIGILSLKFC